jgi:hypothetical protein
MHQVQVCVAVAGGVAVACPLFLQSLSCYSNCNVCAYHSNKSSSAVTTCSDDISSSSVTSSSCSSSVGSATLPAASSISLVVAA